MNAKPTFIFQLSHLHHADAAAAAAANEEEDTANAVMSMDAPSFLVSR